MTSPSRFNPRLLKAAAICTALVPPCMVFSIAIADVLLSLAGILFAIEFLWLRKNGTWVKEPWFLTAMVLWGFMLMRMLALPDFTQSWTNTTFWFRYPLFVAAAMHWILRDQTARRWLWNSVAVILAFLILDSLWQYFTRVDFLGHVRLEAPDLIRLTGPFKDPKVGIVMTWIAFPVLCVLPFGSTRRRVAGILAIALIAVTIWLTGERTAFIMTMFGLGWTALLLPIPKRMLAGAITLKVVAALILAWHAPKLIERQFYSTARILSEFDHTVYGNLWKTALQVIVHNPWFGVGPKQFRHACEAYAIRTGNSLTDVDCAVHLHPHNFYLEWAAQYGLVGLSLFLTLLFLCARIVWQAFSTHRDSPLYIGLFIALLVKLWPLATTTSFYPTWAALPFWLMLGWMLAVARTRREDV